MRVLFRKDKSGEFKGTVTAVMLDEYWCRDLKTHHMSYDTQSQHGCCSMDWVKENTVPATKEEYQRLYTELKTIGYKRLEVIKSLRGVR